MKKVFWVFSICFVLIIVFISIFLLSLSKKTAYLNPFSFPIPTPVSTSTSFNKPNKVFSVSPEDQSDGVSTSSAIKINLSVSTPPETIVFWSYPEFQYTKRVQNGVLIITPTHLLPETTYGYALKFPDGSLSQIYYFSTGKGQQSQDTISQIENSWNKTFNPELFLASALPYSVDDFTVSYNYQSNPPAHYYFSVFLKNPDQAAAKQEFISWAVSLGLSLSQINSLDISYYGGSM